MLELILGTRRLNGLDCAAAAPRRSLVEPINAAVLDDWSECDPIKSTHASSPPTNNAGGRPSFKGLYSLNS